MASNTLDRNKLERQTVLPKEEHNVNCGWKKGWGPRGATYGSLQERASTLVLYQ